MTNSVTENEKLWDDFLNRWPIESLQNITLENYSKAGDPDCFSLGWLEKKTEALGSIYGGSAFKFGVYSRRNKADKKPSSGREYSSDYGWGTKYGATAEAAFENVRNIIVAIAIAARQGDLETIENADLGPAVKWKIAFLYQDRTEPSLLAVFSKEHLRTYLEAGRKEKFNQLQSNAMAKRGDVNLLEFGKQVWDQADSKLAVLSLKPEDAQAYFEDNPDRFEPTKEPTKYSAGFITNDGSMIGLQREGNKTRLWLEPGSWLQKVKNQLTDITEYPPDRQRSSNLAANVPKLALGNSAINVTVPTKAALIALTDVYGVSEGEEDEGNQDPKMTNEHSAPVSPPLNQILFGPPGTGKTYSTIDESLRILDPSFLEKNKANREALKKRFDELVTTGEIRFTTFHQSFSYEDFVEGLRAVNNDDKQLEYVVEPGIFKQVCDDARTQNLAKDIGVKKNPNIWKISINGTGSSATKSYCIDHGEARIGWGETGDLKANGKESDYFKNVGAGNQGTLQYFSDEIEDGDIVLCIQSAQNIGAIGVVVGDYRYEEQVPSEVIDTYQHVRKVNWLYRDLDLSVLPLNANKQFTLKTVYSITRFSWGDLLAYLEQSGIKPENTTQKTVGTEPRVLVIDEINRGNISRIFGELITLIEPSKRAGADEALSVTLPYSKKPFSVPSNVYLIGTMNTADRSLAGLDIALRRRFTFKEMPPKPEVLEGIDVEGINIASLLRTMNERIEVLLDRDHCLGHAYFIPLKQAEKKNLVQLKSIFSQQILPLLKEYFFEDWERIAWVLNDQNKSDDNHKFILKASSNLNDLFGNKVASALQNIDQRWHLNQQAFDDINSYRLILGANQ